MSRSRRSRQKNIQLHYPRFVRTEYLETLNKDEASPDLHEVSETEVDHALQILDPDGDGTISFENLQTVLGALYPQLATREYNFLLSGTRVLRKRSIERILEHESLPSFNPLTEAFRVFDPDDTGYVDMRILKQILTGLGFKNVGEEDIEIALDVADVDGDGRISFDDFARMLDEDLDLDLDDDTDDEGEYEEGDDDELDREGES